MSWDDEGGWTPKRWTPAAEALTTRAGTVRNRFEEAAENVLPKRAGLRLAETTVQRTSEAAGARGKELRRRQQVLGGPQRWHGHRAARGRSCAYVRRAATGVAQQACGGGVAEGRRPYVARVFHPVPELPAACPYQPPPASRLQARYLAGLYDLDEVSRQRRRQAGQVGRNHAEQGIGITDGGNGLENFLTKNFPRDLLVLLDFGHAAEYLADLAKALFPQDEAASERTLAGWCPTLKHQGGQGMVAALAKLSVPPRKPAVREHDDTTIHYLRSNQHRMDYPT